MDILNISMNFYDKIFLILFSLFLKASKVILPFTRGEEQS